MKSYYDDILRQLRSGVKEEEIAANFTNALNQARDAFHGHELYESARKNLVEAWNDAVDAYDFYKGLPNGLTKKELYVPKDENIVENLIPAYAMIKEISNDLREYVPTWRDQVGSK